MGEATDGGRGVRGGVGGVRSVVAVWPSTAMVLLAVAAPLRAQETVIEAQVEQIAGSDIYVDVGSDQGVGPGAVLAVLGPTAPTRRVVCGCRVQFVALGHDVRRNSVSGHAGRDTAAADRVGSDAEAERLPGVEPRRERRAAAVAVKPGADRGALLGLAAPGPPVRG